MIGRLIYSLYLFSLERKTGNYYLMSGGSTFFLIFINIIAFLTIIFGVLDKSFIVFFIKYEYIILGFTLIFFFLSQLYARYIVKRVERHQESVKTVQLKSILTYALISIIFLFISLAIA